MVKNQNCVIWIQTVSLYTLKKMIFTKMLQKMLRKDLTLQIMNQNAILLKVMTKFVGLRAKTYSYLIYDGSEDKKVKCTKKWFIKRKIKFENYKNCLEVTELENETNFLEKNKIDIKSIAEFIKNNKSILKIQQSFKSERHNVFTEEINKVTLSSNDDKRI